MTDLNLGLTQQIIAYASNKGVLRNQLAYILATAYWETNRTMQPVKEAYYLGSKAEAYRKKLRYYPWYGRGLVQLTHERNYKLFGLLDPNEALEPATAVRVLVDGMMDGSFTGQALTTYVTLKQSDFVGARRVVNGLDKATTIAELAREYDEALLEAEYGVEATTLIANSSSDGTPPRTSIMQSGTIRAAYGALATVNATGLWNAFTALTWQGQVAFVASTLVVTLFLFWIIRERIKHWTNGVR